MIEDSEDVDGRERGHSPGTSATLTEQARQIFDMSTSHRERRY